MIIFCKVNSNNFGLDPIIAISVLFHLPKNILPRVYPEGDYLV